MYNLWIFLIVVAQKMMYRAYNTGHVQKYIFVKDFGQEIEHRHMSMSV
mgnify:CR=1 FL=1